MREFFGGWRRKAGCILLIVALTFMGGWLRSRYAVDVIKFPVHIHRTGSSGSITFCCLISDRDCLVWDRADEYFTESDPNEETDLGTPYPIWQSSSNHPNFDQPQIKWRWRSCGFGACEYFDKDAEFRESFLFIPYWSIAVPLTIVSAYLLFRKPPKPTRSRLNTPSHSVDHNAPQRPSAIA